MRSTDSAARPKPGDAEPKGLKQNVAKYGHLLRKGVPMLAVPIPLLLALQRESDGLTRDSDCPTMDDPLPAVVETSTGGYVLSRSTRVTEVKRETTDDN
mgnify:FL=1|jgi:hypothetical protein